MEQDLVANVVLKGGAGSGFHGHKGRPGEEGGSLPRGSSAVVILQPGSMLFQQLGYADKYKRLVNHSYFKDIKKKVLDEKLETSLQQQYEVLGFDPLEMIRRGRNKIYLQTDSDFEASYKYYHNKLPDSVVIGCVSPTGSIYLRCGSWTPYYQSGKLSEYDLNDTLDIETINHEFGHVLWDVTGRPSMYFSSQESEFMQSGGQAKLDFMHGYEYNGIGRHTKYSNRNYREGFAESYMSYVTTGGVSTDPDVSKTYEAVKKVIDAAKLKYAK
jgi:hypothetical protein